MFILSFMIFFFSLSTQKLESVRSREDENYFVIIRLDNSSYIFDTLYSFGSLKFFAVNFLGLSIFKKLYGSLVAFSEVIVL